jgi:hypothetical protein
MFKRDLGEIIQKGRNTKIAGDTRLGTFADLFEGYVHHLRSADKCS